MTRAAAQSRAADELAPLAFAPPGWAEQDPGQFRIFNPSLLRSGDGFIVAFRVVDGVGNRRIAIARLDVRFRKLPEAAQPLSDLIEFAPALAVSSHSRSWFADPRLFRLGSRIYVSWNDGMPVGRLNSQFLVEIDEVSLHPLGFARRLRHRGGQLRHQKNWMLFSDSEGWKAVYGISPHRILVLDEETDSELVFRDGWTTMHRAGAYTSKFGELRGGAQPVLQGDVYYHFCHSCRDDGGGRRYVATVYTFSAKPPFQVVSTPLAPLALPEAGFPARGARLNEHASHVVYPSGAAVHGDGWALSYGLQDSHAVLCLTTRDEVSRTLVTAASSQPFDRLLFPVTTHARWVARALLHRWRSVLGVGPQVKERRVARR